MKKLKSLLFAFAIIFLLASFIACSDRATYPNNFSGTPNMSMVGLLDVNGNIIPDSMYGNIISVTNIVEKVYTSIRDGETYYWTNYITVTNEKIIKYETNYAIPPAEPTDLYRVWLPSFAGVQDGKGIYNYTNVSYKDLQGLKNLWSKIVNRYGDGQGARPFFIRNNTRHAWYNIKTGNNYYFFDKDLNIRHRNHPNIILKKFICGLVVRFVNGDYKGTWSVGALYENGLNKFGSGGYADMEWGIREFMRHEEGAMGSTFIGRDKGFPQIYYVNTGLNANNHTEFVLSTRYSSQYNSWHKQSEYFIGERIEFYWNHLNKDIDDTKFMISHGNREAVNDKNYTWAEVEVP